MRDPALVRQFDKNVPKGFHGENVIATLHHPRLKGGKLELVACVEREAIRQAWRFAISDNLAGFKITTKKGLMP